MKPTDWREVLHLLQREGHVRDAGPRVKAWREEKGWTLAELGAAVGIDKSVVWKIENRKRDLTVVEALRVSEALGRTLVELLLPDETQSDLRAAIDTWAMYDEAEAAIVQIGDLWARYEWLVGELRKRPKDDLYRARAEGLRRQQVEYYRPRWETYQATGMHGASLEEFAGLQEPTPQGQMAQDVLSAELLPSTPWAYRGKAPADRVDRRQDSPS